MDQEGTCTTWFTLSAADDNWLDSKRYIYGDREMPVFATESQKSLWRRNLVRKNLCTVDTYFTDRVNAFIKTFFG